MSKYADLPIQVMENKANGMQAIKLTEPPFDGIIYTYGKVEFIEDNDNDKLNLSFEYEVLDNANKGMTDMKPFELYIGKILEELIHIGVEENSITYTGGVDENRTKDSDESDT
jgi:hypothetical protein